VAEKLADVYALSTERIGEITSANALSVYATG
jgi:hypothetical protein